MRLLSKARNEILTRPVTNDLIQDLLPDSSSAYMLICGRSGIGKTFLALNVLFCLATGEPFLGKETKPCKVGYLSMEGSDVKILNRFETIKQSFPPAEDNIYWEHTTAITLNDSGTIRLEEIITGLEVVIIDPLRPLVAGDYTSPKDANNFLKRLQTIQNETGTRLILIHHIRKPDKRVKVLPEDLMFEVKGAAEYVEAATTVLLLEKAIQPHDNFGRFLSGYDERTLHFLKVKDAPTELTPVTLHFNRETLLFKTLLNQ
jgi:RecA-family ATPase